MRRPSAYGQSGQVRSAQEGVIFHCNTCDEPFAAEPMLQRDLMKMVKASSAEAVSKIAKLAGSLDAGQLHEHPEPAGWSVGEVLEHLCISDDLLHVPLNRVLAGAPRDAGAALRDWKPSFLGRMIAGSLSRPRKVKAPRIFQPGATPRGGVLQALLDNDRKVMASMDDSSALDWRLQRISSPALPPWAPRLNLGDIFNIHGVHLTRHAMQVERLVKLLA